MAADPADPLTWLFGLQRFGMRPGLERMTQLLERLGRPDRALRCVLVGGTNGKGSTARVLAACLGASGGRIGLYTSPHLIELRERVAIDGEPLGSADMAASVDAVRPEADALGSTFFEVVTAAALLAFAGRGVAWAVLEVGLGGRFDATNAVAAELALVTNVALDHTAVLGNDVASIAREKAGIARSGRVVWSAAEGPAAVALEAAVLERGARLATLDRDAVVGIEPRGWDGVRVTLGAPTEGVTLLSPLVGAHQGRNVALAAIAASALGLSERALAAGAAAARWPGRLERLRHRGRWVVLDGAHNPAAAEALAHALRTLPGRPDALILGVSLDKDLAGVTGALRGLAPLGVATRAAWSPRAAAPDVVAEALGDGALRAPGPPEALELALERVPPGGTVVVAGSLFLVGEVRALLLGRAPEGRERLQ